MDVAAGLTGLVAGIAAAPLADVIATNAPLHDPLLRRVPLSRRLPLVLLATAGLGAACGLVLGLTLDALVGAFFCWILVVVTRTDLEHRLIPDLVVVPGAVLILALRTIDDPGVEWIASALAAGLFLFVLAFLYPAGLGMGDVKLSAFLGAGLGYVVGIALFVGFFAAFVPAAALLVRHRAGARKMAIPLGPFLAFGGVVAFFAGEDLWDWYRQLGT